jgi:hypothetical protein
MPLIQAQLTTDFSRIFKMQANPSIVAKELALAYHTYASLSIAMTAVPCPIISPGNVSALETMLLPALIPGPPGRLEMAWINGLPLYWLTAVFSGPPIAPSTAPTVSAPGGITILSQSLMGVLSSTAPNEQMAGQILATALHLVTSTAIVAFATAPPGILL